MIGEYAGVDLSHLAPFSLFPFDALFPMDRAEILKGWIHGEQDPCNLWFYRERDPAASSDAVPNRWVPKFMPWGIWGLQTLSLFRYGPLVHSTILRHLFLTKRAALIASYEGLKDSIGEKRTAALIEAARQYLEKPEGWLMHHMPVSVIQGGVGTGIHMMVNEMITNEAIRLIGGKKGDYEKGIDVSVCWTNQSTNDVVPTAIRLAVRSEIVTKIMDALQDLYGVTQKRRQEFMDGKYIVLVRTEGQPAGLLLLADIFQDYLDTLGGIQDRMGEILALTQQVTLGGTIVGAGHNASPEYIAAIPFALADSTGERGWNLHAKLLSQARDPADFETVANHFDWVGRRIRNIVHELAGFFRDHTLEHPPVLPGGSLLLKKRIPHWVEVIEMHIQSLQGKAATIRREMESGADRTNANIPHIGNRLIGCLADLEGALRVARELMAGLQPNRPQMVEDIVHHALPIVHAVAARFPRNGDSLVARAQGYLETLGKPPTPDLILEALLSGGETLELKRETIQGEFDRAMADLSRLARPHRWEQRDTSESSGGPPALF